jgi:hypothetical protein
MEAPTLDFYIESGVRRSVAARKLGLASILARLHEGGQQPKLMIVPLEDLHSPKSEIVADQRYRDVLQAMSTPQGRASIAQHSPIDIQVLGADPCQAPTVPLKDVQLLPETP